MSWQDLVLAVGGFIIAAGIVPTILSPLKPPLTTSSTIFAVLGVSTVAFATLGLWLTAAGAALQFALWGTVLVQTVIARRAVLDAAPAVTEPVLAAPPLGFEEYRPDETGAA